MATFLINTHSTIHLRYFNTQYTLFILHILLFHNIIEHNESLITSGSLTIPPVKQASPCNTRDSNYLRSERIQRKRKMGEAVKRKLCPCPKIRTPSSTLKGKDCCYGNSGWGISHRATEGSQEAEGEAEEEV